MTGAVIFDLDGGRASRYVEYISGAIILTASAGLLLFYDACVRFTGQWFRWGRTMKTGWAGPEIGRTRHRLSL